MKQCRILYEQKEKLPPKNILKKDTAKPGFRRLTFHKKYIHDIFIQGGSIRPEGVPLCSAKCRIGRRMIADYDDYDV
jgi:hypothetical protein